MKIGIYEEFPTRDNLERLRNIPVGIELVLAARSLVKFRRKETYVIRRFPHIVESITYWPTLLKREGYWFSPFANPEAVNRVLGEIEQRGDKERLRVMLDLETPAMVNLGLLIRGIPTFDSVRRRIEKFISRIGRNNLDLVCTEMPTLRMPEAMQRYLGLAFDPVKFGCEKTKMFYTSWAKLAADYLGQGFSRNSAVSLLKDEIRWGVRKYGEKFSIGLGFTAPGIMGTEPVMTVEQLEEELAIARKMGVHKAYIFRLKGMTEAHGEVLKKFSISAPGRI